MFLTMDFGDTFYNVILDSYNESTMNYLRNLVYSGRSPSNVEEAVWRALEWVDENIEYDYSKSLFSIFYDIYDPVTFAREGYGICSDYAVFLSATLLSVGIEPVYILSLNTTMGGHAVAAVEIDNALYILDQHLPVIEWDDYRQYVFNIVETVYVYKITYNVDKGPTIEFYELRKEYIDTYPEDEIDPDLVKDVCKELSTLLNTQCSILCRHQYSWKTKWTWEVLKYYSPTFHKQWINYIVENIREDLPEHTTCIWIEKTSSTTLIIYYS